MSTSYRNESDEEIREDRFFMFLFRRAFLLPYINEQKKSDGKSATHITMRKKTRSKMLQNEAE